MEKWSIINIQRWIRKAKSMLHRHNRAKIVPQLQKTFATLSSSSKTKTKHRRIHIVHHLPSSQILKQRLPTTMHRFYKTKQCNTNTNPRTQINETQNNHQTISENTSIGPKTINSPSICTELPFSKRRTQVIFLPTTNSPITNKLDKVLPTNLPNLPSHSPSLSDRMELDIHPVRGGSTQSFPTIYK